MNDQMYIEYMRLDEFISRSHSQNPKKHDLNAIGRSINRFGFVETPTLDERTGQIAAGHGRGAQLWTQMQGGEAPPARIKTDADGMWMLPVLRGVAFNSDEELQAYLIASNRLVESGGWDADALMELRAGIDDDLWSVTGFGDDVFGDLISGPVADDGLNFGAFEVPGQYELRYQVVIKCADADAAHRIADQINGRLDLPPGVTAEVTHSRERIGDDVSSTGGDYEGGA